MSDAHVLKSPASILPPLVCDEVLSLLNQVFSSEVKYFKYGTIYLFSIMFLCYLQREHEKKQCFYILNYLTVFDYMLLVQCVH
jgi:hypothetical protein